MIPSRQKSEDQQADDENSVPTTRPERVRSFGESPKALGILMNSDDFWGPGTGSERDGSSSGSQNTLGIHMNSDDFWGPATGSERGGPFSGRQKTQDVLALLLSLEIIRIHKDS